MRWSSGCKSSCPAHTPSKSWQGGHTWLLYPAVSLQDGYPSWTTVWACECRCLCPCAYVACPCAFASMRVCLLKWVCVSMHMCVSRHVCVCTCVPCVPHALFWHTTSMLSLGAHMQPAHCPTLAPLVRACSNLSGWRLVGPSGELVRQGVKGTACGLAKDLLAAGRGRSSTSR